MQFPSTGRLASPISVAIVDDDDLLRDNLSLLLEGASGFRCVGAYSSADQAVSQIPQERPDVVLMDISLGEDSGIDCVRRLGALGRSPAIIMFTGHQEDEMLFDALRAGASGYLVKPVQPLDVLGAIIDVHRGGAPMSRQIAKRILTFFRQRDPARRSMPGITDREREILNYLSSGCTEKQIAASLGLDRDEVHQNIRNIYQKLHVSNREQALRKFLHPEDSGEDNAAPGGRS